ncbi:MAG: SHOCT domain-containing protein [Acidimicrobiia bacterium]|nr:SHOCT domain-containing protein [Acidimicrobiia bacterium]
MASLTQLLADGGSSGHMDWGDGGWWMLMFWGPILFIGLTGLVAWFIRSTQGPGAGGRSGAHRDDPLDGARRILAERYARGELDSDEYQERVERLG